MTNRLLKASQRQEQRIADRLNGRRTPGSGNGIRKNDVRTEDLSLEMKFTGKKQYTIKSSELEQGEKHAIMDGRDFAFGISLNDHNWVILSEDDWIALREEAAHPSYRRATWVKRGPGPDDKRVLHLDVDTRHNTVEVVYELLSEMLQAHGFHEGVVTDGS